jgi:hypothetical protein
MAALGKGVVGIFPKEFFAQKKGEPTSHRLAFWLSRVRRPQRRAG